MVSDISVRPSGFACKYTNIRSKRKKRQYVTSLEKQKAEAGRPGRVHNREQQQEQEPGLRSKTKTASGSQAFNGRKKSSQTGQKLLFLKSNHRVVNLSVRKNAGQHACNLNASRILPYRTRRRQRPAGCLPAPIFSALGIAKMPKFAIIINLFRQSGKNQILFTQT